MQIAPFNPYLGAPHKPETAAVANGSQPDTPESQSSALPETAAHDRSRTVPETNAAAEKSPHSADQDHDAAQSDDPVKNATYAAKRPQEMSEEELRALSELKLRDREVRAHEQAHLAAAGGIARGGPSFEYQRGPDGQRYAVGGEVNIDVGPVHGNPQETIAKAQQIRRAALAPAEPSGQDRAVAAQATAMEQQARAELARTTDAAPGEETETTTTAGANHGISESAKANNNSGNTACELCGLSDHSSQSHSDAIQTKVTSAISGLESAEGRSRFVAQA